MKSTLLQMCRLAVLSAFLCAMPALAQESASGWVRHPEVSMRLVSATTATGSSPVVRLGLEMALKPGWKTYWRSPGDAGLPVEIDWTGSANLGGAKLRYPAPERFTLFDLETFGYGGTVILPIDATLAAPGVALDVRAGIDVLVCADVCIPYRADLALALPAGPGAPSAHAHDIARFDSAVPPVDATGVGANGLVVEGADFRGGPSAAIVVRARAEPAFAAPDVYVEGPAGWSFAKPVVRYAEGGRAATLTVPATGGPGAGPLRAGADITLTLVEGARAVERAGALGNAPPAAPPAALLAMLAVALLGGLILNLMPCVLPVLAMKLASVVTLDAARARDVRRAFLATAAGIVSAFLLLALALVGLKLGGEAVGWGLQFQQPWFLAGMALVVVAFAANLWGWFEVPLPALLSDIGGSRKLAGSFATGVFATLLATPCSAPFVGTAVGFALAQGPLQILAIFAALGVGLAAPYLAVAAFPGAARLLPRPGPWIGILRRLLGLALAGTAAWLVWVLSGQLGILAAGTLAAALVALAGGLFALRNAQTPRGRVTLVASVLLLALFLPPKLGYVPERVADTSTIAWQRFERGAIDMAVAEGKTVFVDVTADWCVTCQVNKRLVLSRAEIAEKLASDGVVALRADWTRPDPRIAAYLAEFGRYGIPFNAVYGPGAPGGLALPELLSAEAVLGALGQAAAR
jgi:suppressor for copper-sensitivity B